MEFVVEKGALKKKFLIEICVSFEIFIQKYSILQDHSRKRIMGAGKKIQYQQKRLAHAFEYKFSNRKKVRYQFCTKKCMPNNAILSTRPLPFARSRILII